MKTSIQKIIEKLKDGQNHIINDSEYAKGYDGALSDCINVAESYFQKEKEINTEILEMLIDIKDAIESGENYSAYKISELIKKSTL